MKISLVLAAFGLALALGLRAHPAAACSGGVFSFEYLADYLGSSDVVAIGTLTGVDGATIGLDVDVYYKAPAGSSPHLVLNNLRQDGLPDCSSRPLRMRAYAEGTQVLVLLKQDEQGIGANWRGSMIQGRGVLPLKDGKIVHYEWDETKSHLNAEAASRAEFEAELSKLGIAPAQPSRTTAPERPKAPESPFTCMYDAHTIGSLISLATVAGIGVIVGITPDVFTVRIDEPLKRGAGPLTVTVNNHFFTGGLSQCQERLGGGNRILSDREPIFLFLAPDTSGTGAEWRPGGIDGEGLFLPGDIPWPNASGNAQLTFEELRDEVRRIVGTDQGGPVTPAPPVAGNSRASQDEGQNATNWIVLIAACVGAVVVAAFLVLRRRQAGRRPVM